MRFTHGQRRLPLLAGAVAIAAMGTMTACGGGENGPASTTSTTTTTTSTSPSPSSTPPPPPPPASPTLNQIDPNGPNSFTPSPIPVPGPVGGNPGLGSPANPHNR